MDKAFFRRFDTMIHFQEPDEQLRYMIWKKALSPFQLDAQINLHKLARKYKKNGAFIKRIRHYLGLQATAREDFYLSAQDLEMAIERHS